MSQKLLLKYFKWVEDVSELNKDFIKCYGDESDERYFLKLMFNIPKIYITFTMVYHFYLKELKLKKSTSF